MDSVTVEMTADIGAVYYIPNTFTPDGDKYNQSFKPVLSTGVSSEGYEMLIFNRWGELIFESYDASQGWDGSYGLKGKPVQDGIYTYKIVFKNPKLDDRITVTGHVTLIR
jgi:gliding motility-associated-like protein